MNVPCREEEGGRGGEKARSISLCPSSSSLAFSPFALSRKKKEFFLLRPRTEKNSEKRGEVSEAASSSLSHSLLFSK